MKIINAQSNSLNIDRFDVQSGQSWCVVGSNRSGIRDFFDLICGQNPEVIAEDLTLPDNLDRICFKDQQKIYEQELKNDDTDYLDRQDPGTLGKEFISNAELHKDLIDKLKMTACMDKGYRQLSTGQTRKLLIISQIAKGQSTLAIQAPYEGLDSQSRDDVSDALAYLFSRQVQLFLFVHNAQDIPSWCTHLALIQDGKLTVQGPRENVSEKVIKKLEQEPPDFHVSAQDLFSDQSEQSEQSEQSDQGQDQIHQHQNELVCLKNGSAGYGGELVFNDLSFTLHEGDHTLITGPNGCGKSTLLHVITGDHPACYKNDLEIFNIQRGTGESIWELKKRMGIVSPELHRNYYIPGSTKSCIISGLFDSIGIYNAVNAQQEEEAERWLSHLGMTQKGGASFRDLTFADQRLVLIARALIKQPDLLILDEPTQGLDAPNRKALLDFLDEMTRLVQCTILYVSHREDEFRSFFVNHLQMGKH